jgi:hypothetical protein
MVIVWMAFVLSALLCAALLLYAVGRTFPSDTGDRDRGRFRSRPSPGPRGIPGHEAIDPSQPRSLPQRRYRPARLVTWSVSQGEDEPGVDT